MKNSISILFFILFTILASRAQQWPAVGTRWYYESYASFETVHSGLNFFEVIRDTLFENKNCVLLNSGDILYSDTIGNVYRYNHFQDKFSTLFKFNASIGDSLYVFTEYFEDSVLFVVEKIDTIIINTLSKKRFSLHPVENFEWSWGSIIENIGSDYNMFPQNGLIDPCFCGPLRCYEDLSLGLYKADMNSPCTAGVEPTISPIKNKFEVYPNPFSNHFTITSEGNTEIRIAVYDVTGGLVKHYETHSYDNLGDDLPPGVYLLKLSNAHSMSCIKVVKMR